MKEFNYTITDPQGIHARPAGILVKEAAKFSSDINIVKDDGKSGSAKKIFAVMGLGIKQGMTVTVKCDGADEDAAAAALEEFFKTNL